MGTILSGARSRARRSGFTLIELLVVIAILATLVGLGVFAVSRTLRGAETTKRNTYAATLKSAIVAYKNENGSYPIPSSSGSGTTITYGTVTDSNSPQRGNAEVILMLYGRTSSGKRDSTKRAYITDSSMLYVCKGGKHVSKLDDALAKGSVSSGDMIGFPITMNKAKGSKNKALSAAKAFAPVRISFDFELDYCTVEVPSYDGFGNVVKLN